MAFDYSIEISGSLRTVALRTVALRTVATQKNLARYNA